MTDEARRLLAGVALVCGAIMLVQAIRSDDTNAAGLAFACFVTISGAYGILRPRGADAHRDDGRSSEALTLTYVLIYLVSLGVAIALIVWGALSGGAEMVAGAILATPLLILGLAGMRLLLGKMWRRRRPSGHGDAGDRM